MIHKTVLNHLDIRGAVEVLETLVENHVTDCDLNFHSIVPMPKEVIFAGRKNPQDRDYLAWVHQNWGGALEDGSTEVLLDRPKGVVHFRYETLSHPSTPIAQKLSERYPDVEVHHQFCDADFLAGSEFYRGGKQISFLESSVSTEKRREDSMNILKMEP